LRKETVVKLSHPIKNYGYDNLGARGQSPGNLGVWGDYRFEINTDVEECDFWVIFESVPQRTTASVPEGNTIAVFSEPAHLRDYSPDYARQFDWIFTWRNDIGLSNVMRSWCLDGWWLKRTYDQLKNEHGIEKSKSMCVIASNKAAVDGHRKRFAFINRLIGHFKDRLDVFGSINGNYCDDKYSALLPYRYSIAIESMSSPDYWTEKIADCFLTETMPLYYGCPNITDYFSPDSLVSIDIDDYKTSIQAIEKALEEDAYEKNRPRVLEAKHRILDELQVFPHLVRLLETHRKRTDMERRATRELIPATKQVEMLNNGAKLERLLLR
jgi:Glycosyltransferase family 10 (fucosyltransferase) C-term